MRFAYCTLRKKRGVFGWVAFTTLPPAPALSSSGVHRHGQVSIGIVNETSFQGPDGNTLKRQIKADCLRYITFCCCGALALKKTNAVGVRDNKRGPCIKPEALLK
jgi:hypothetical protein